MIQSVSDGFVHLHNHTEYSMLDGSARIGDLAARARDLGMPAVAVTDHGNLYGSHEFYRTMRTAGVKPIIGMEGYLTPRTHRTDRSRVNFGDGSRDDVASKGAYTHLTIWAETTAGMHNLFRISSLASIDGFFHHPRLDRELLQTYGKGLIATTGCPSGEVQTFLHFGKYREALESAAEFRDILGEGNYYVELMDHGLDIERRVRQDLLKIAKDLNLPLVATNDLHYSSREDAHAHEALLCLQSAATLQDPTYDQGGNRFAFNGQEYYLKTAEEMRHVFRELPEACDNTLAIAERCNVEFTEGEGRFMPHFPVPDGESEESWFIKEVERGLHRRYPGGVPDAARERADYETSVILGKGYPGYYLVVADFIGWAHERGIRTGLRGSGAGSICAYAMGISDLDPLRFKLTFERFLNPERQSMPDFDIDFDDRRRPEVIEYVSQKYGTDHVAQIITYGTIKTKQAIKDAARIQSLPFTYGDEINKALPPAVMGKDIPLREGVFNPDHPRYDEAQDFRDKYESDANAKLAVDTAMGIENLKRQTGVHAAGVIMASEPLLDLIPLVRREDGAILTQFDYPTCETLGLVKMDFLGLRNLTILSDALASIEAQGKEVPDFDSPEMVAMDDEETFALLGRGDALGVFQLDGAPMQSLLRLMVPKRIQDIMATIALYRPGPMGINSHINYALRRRGDQPVEYPHPELAEILEPVLGDNFGLCVYQEDVIEVARLLAGYTLGRADMLRRAMGKKKKDVLDAEYATFEQGMKDRGFSPQAIKAVWDALMPFADYGFGKAHAAAYAVVAYRTAYLKAHYPAEYMAAVLESVKDNKDKLAIYLHECRRLGIEVLPPDVNESRSMFTPSGEAIRFGLSAVRNVGEGVVQSITTVRNEQGRFTTFEDFLRKTGANKRVTESLVKAGAFDSLGQPRQGMLLATDRLVEVISEDRKQKAVGQDSLFGEETWEEQPIPQIEWDRQTLLAFEREYLGLYVSDHPLSGMSDLLEEITTTNVASLMAEAVVGEEEQGAEATVKDGDQVTLAGTLISVEVKRSKRGSLYARAVLEDLTGSVECMVFSKTYQKYSAILTQDAICSIKGRINMRDDRLAVFADEIDLIETRE